MPPKKLAAKLPALLAAGLLAAPACQSDNEPDRVEPEPSVEQKGDSVGEVVELCEPGDCGPALGMPNVLCPDGVTVAGPGDCVWNDDADSCAWEIIHCPEPVCGPDDCGPAPGSPCPSECVYNADAAECAWQIECPPVCGPGDCGPQLGMPNYLCPDGETVAGPGDCVYNEKMDGCGWEIIDCPE